MPTELVTIYYNGHFTQMCYPEQVDDVLAKWGLPAESIEVVQLSDASTYQGGHLEFFGSQLNDSLREQGSITFFPSYQHHRVTPILEGFRFSLVIWMSGNPYK